MIYLKPKHNIKKKIYPMMVRAYQSYPKLSCVFPSFEKRLVAIELTLRFYGAFNFKYGKCISTDETLNDIAMYIYSEESSVTEEKKNKAKCYERSVVELFSRLNKEERILWENIFSEIEKEEENIDLPEKYIYIDFLAVEPELQNKGKGKALLEYIKAEAEKEKRDVVLFTNTDEHISYYEKQGFEKLTKIELIEYGIENTYMIWRHNG